MYKDRRMDSWKSTPRASGRVPKMLPGSPFSNIPIHNIYINMYVHYFRNKTRINNWPTNNELQRVHVTTTNDYQITQTSDDRHSLMISTFN